MHASMLKSLPACSLEPILWMVEWKGKLWKALKVCLLPSTAKYNKACGL